MNAKTYGQVLMGELNAHVEGLRLSIADSNALERCARAVILEFVRRVEEDAAARVASGDWDDPPYTYAVTTSEAFDELSTEIKEAK